MTLMNPLAHRFAGSGAREMRRGRYAVAALIVMGSAACDHTTEGTGPQVPGSISITTETSGFMKDDSYDVLVDGESRGTIGANDEMTIPGLDPATYEVALAGLADNCVAEGSASATVAPDETSDVALSVVCAPDEPTPYSVRANRDRPNLDDGSMTECTFGICPSNEEWDLYAHFNSQTDPQAEIRPNQTTGVEIAHLAGMGLDDLTEPDVAGATFTTELVGEPFDSGRVILVRTDAGSVYALGNPSEDTILLTLTFGVTLLIAGS